MRIDHRFDETAPIFHARMPWLQGRAHHMRVRARSEGNLTFTIGSQVVAEIEAGDLLESWAAAEELTARSRQDDGSGSESSQRHP